MERWEEARERALTNRLPAAASDALLNDSGLVLFSIDPDRYSSEHADAKRFHDYPILGETVVASPSSRQALAATLASSLAAWDGTVSFCFHPRHGLRATHGGNTYDFLICFQCGFLYLYQSTGDRVGFGLIGGPGPFRDILAAANVPVVKPYNEQ